MPRRQKFLFKCRCSFKLVNYLVTIDSILPYNLRLSYEFIYFLLISRKTVEDMKIENRVDGLDHRSIHIYRKIMGAKVLSCADGNMIKKLGITLN